jgi:hypothetical protein
MRCKRPRRRAAESSDEFAPSKANAHLPLPVPTRQKNSTAKPLSPPALPAGMTRQATAAAVGASISDFVLIGVILITPAGDEGRSGPGTSCVSSPALFMDARARVKPARDPRRTAARSCASPRRLPLGRRGLVGAALLPADRPKGPATAAHLGGDDGEQGRRGACNAVVI